MRKTLLWGLVIASAISMMMQYILQGALATGHVADFFGGMFWTVDSILWGLRAIIEAAVVAYLFQTKTESKSQQRALAWLEFALIALIALTLGPALRAIGTGKSMAASLQEPFFTIWNYGIAAYAPLMIGSAGFAYKCQPVDDDDLAQADAQVKNLLAQLGEKDKEIETLQAAQSAQSTEQVQAIPQLQPATGGNQRKVDLQELLALALANPQAQGRWYAEQLGVSPSAITRSLQSLEASGQLHRNGHGWAAQAEAEPQAQEAAR